MLTRLSNINTFCISTGWVDGSPNHNERSPWLAWGAKVWGMPTIRGKEERKDVSLVPVPWDACKWHVTAEEESA